MRLNGIPTPVEACLESKENKELGLIQAQKEEQKNKEKQFKFILKRCKREVRGAIKSGYDRAEVSMYLYQDDHYSNWFFRFFEIRSFYSHNSYPNSEIVSRVAEIFKEKGFRVSSSYHQIIISWCK